jgi:hypothetical protein
MSRNTLLSVSLDFSDIPLTSARIGPEGVLSAIELQKLIRSEVAEARSSSEALRARPGPWKHVLALAVAVAAYVAASRVIPTEVGWFAVPLRIGVAVAAAALLYVAFIIVGRMGHGVAEDTRDSVMPARLLESEQTSNLPAALSSELGYGHSERRITATPPGVPEYLDGWIEGDPGNEYYLVRLVFRLGQIGPGLVALRLTFTLSKDCSPEAVVWATYPRIRELRDSFTTSAKLGADLPPFKAEAGVERSTSIEVGFVQSRGELTQEAQWDYQAGLIAEISGQIQVAVITCRPPDIACSATVAAKLVIREGSERRVYAARLSGFNDELVLAV